MSMPSRMLLIWRLVLVVLAVLAMWRIAVLGMADHYAANMEEGTGETADRVLAWDPDNAQALYLKARESVESDAQGAVELARRSLRANPSDARPLVVLAYAYLKLGDRTRADALMDEAVRLMPAKVSVRLAAVDYWVQGNDLDKALENMSLALHAKAGLGKQMFPILLKLAETPEARPALGVFLRNPPVWWDAFFAYAMQRAITLETVAFLSAMRGESPVALSGEERRALVRRLLRDREWAAAYLAWVNSLERDQRAYLGSVYNGGFELEASNEGFDWHLPRFKGVNASRQTTYGIRGKNALRIIFSGRELEFTHLFQYLFLAPGNYDFYALARPDQLQGRGGLKWTVRCADDPQRLLGESERLIGASEWRRIRFGFTVPPDACAGQILRLESTGNTLYDHKLEGEIWFDEVVVRLARDS